MTTKSTVDLVFFVSLQEGLDKAVAILKGEFDWQLIVSSN